MGKAGIHASEKLFVGRQLYIETFSTFIKEPRHRMLFVHGPGGIGKTWLLRQLMEEARALDVGLLIPTDFIDMYSTSVHSINGMRACIVGLLEKGVKGADFSNFRKKQRELDIGIREGFDTGALEHLRNQVGQAFFEDCEKVTGHSRPILFLDTFEQVQDDIVGKWVMRDLVRNLPDFLFVIMSRRQWFVNGFVNVVSLAGFEEQEAYEYFLARGVPSKIARTLEPLRERAKGSPLLIELGLEWLSGDLLRESEKLLDLSQEAFEEAMIRALREIAQLFGTSDLDEVIYVVLLMMAYMNRRFNAHFLDLLASEELVDLQGHTPTEVIDWLTTGDFLFVKERPDGDVQLHDEMERLVMEYLWPAYDPSGNLRRELAQIVIGWYDYLIESSPDSEIADDLCAERIAYVSRLNPQKGRHEFNQLFDAALANYRFSLAEAAASEIRKQRDNFSDFYTSQQQYDLFDRLEKLSYRLNQYYAMGDYAEDRLNLAKREANVEWQIEALRALHTAVWRIDIRRALGYLEEALALCERESGLSSHLPRLTYLMGFTYRNMQKLEVATEWLEKCQEVSQQQGDAYYMASALNDWGYARATMGDHVRATRRVKEALKLRLHLSQGRPDVYVGSSYNTLGEVTRYAGDLSSAEAHYRKAAGIFEEIQNYEWMAIALHALGDTQRQIASAADRRKDVDTRDSYYALARENFMQSQELYLQHGLTLGKDTFYRRFGRLLRDEDDLDGARIQFGEGLRIAVETEDNLEVLENLIELAFIAALKKDTAAVQGYHEQINARANSVYQWEVFPLLLKVVQAELNYAQGNIEKALGLYLEGLSGLAQKKGYGVALFHTYSHRLLDRRDALPEIKQVQYWCDRIEEIWKDTGLIKTYPDLVESCQLHLRTMNFYRGMDNG